MERTKDIPIKTDNFFEKNKNIIIGSILIVSSILFYRFFWNKVFAVNVEGWFEYYAVEMNKGKVPYKDFYLFTTPVFPLTLKFIFSLFGSYFYLSHIMGVAVNILCCLFMYFIAIEIGVDVILSSLVCFVSMCIFSVDTGEPTNYYNHEAILFMIVASFLYIRSLKYKSTEKYLLVLSGLFSALCFFTKQTIGIVWISSYFFMAICELLINKNNNEKGYLYYSISRCALIFSGLCIPSIVIFSWLYSNGALYDFFDQTLLRGPSSKGGITVIASRPIMGIFRDKSAMGLPFFASLMLSFSLISLSKNKKYFLISSVALLFTFIFAGFHMNDRFFNRFLIYTGVSTSFFFIINVLYKIFFVRTKINYFSSLVLVCCSAMSISTWFALGMSFPVFEPMAMTAIAPPFICLLMYSKNILENKDIRNFIYFPCIALCSIIVYNTAVFKFMHPWSWSGWTEPEIGLSTQKSSMEMLSHLKLPRSTIDVVESTVLSVKKYSLSNNDVYMYPFFPSLYMLSGKDSYAFTYAPFIDVAPDFALQKDLEILKKQKPHVIVKLDYPPSWIAGLEGGFRGKETTQSEFYNYINNLSKSYRVVNEKRIFGDVWLRVYVEK